jgi:hypothetical protein
MIRDSHRTRLVGVGGGAVTVTTDPSTVDTVTTGCIWVSTETTVTVDTSVISRTMVDPEARMVVGLTMVVGTSTVTGTGIT